MRTLILLLISALAHAQSNVPEKYWIDDSNFEDVVGNNNAFGDDNNETIVVEFWAKFNEANCFNEWKQIKDASYYRVDISKAPQAKKKYRVRMVPTVLVFKSGSMEKIFKAGLDLTLPVGLAEIQEAINEINLASNF
ncbi:MAG: thioredoxin [Bacteroidetes bacterium]|nr:MAG: thioredoxin [Bacteroidota bacterium]REK59734.1 MAG: thioredoxin [Bacteroidota bacterium]